MSQENVESLKLAWDGFNRGDLDAFTEALADDCEFHEDPAFPDGGIYHGPDEIRAYILRFQETMSEHRFELEEIRDLGDRVLVLARERARGVISGAEVEMAPAFLYRFRGSSVVRVDAFIDRRRALEAAGLSK